MTETIEGEATEIVDPPQAAGAIEVRERGTSLVATDEITVEQLVAQHQKIQEAMRVAMQDGHHYGRIPGVPKPTLLKPGAEKLLVLFRLAPSYRSERTWHDDGHLTVVANCELRHIPTGLLVAAGEGLCTTRESRYAYRTEERVCPTCGKPAIIKGKAEYGGGWLCFKKKDGCGEKYADGDPRIETQAVGKVPNPDLPDTYNTVLKMADKRALVAAILNGTAASDVFTQDVEDSGAADLAGSSADSGAQADHRASAPEQDPATVLPEAFRGDHVNERVGEALRHIHPSVDWRDIWEQANRNLYGSERAGLATDALKIESVVRLANVADRLTAAGDFPPPTDEQIVQAFADMFGGAIVAVVRHEPVEYVEQEAMTKEEEDAMHAAMQVDEDIPFGEEDG